MDMTAIAALTSALSGARDLASAALGLRDSNLISEAVSGLNQKILDAQNALLAHNAMLLQLQEEHFKSTGEVRRLQEALDDRARYTLVDLGNRQFACRVNQAPTLSGSGEPLCTEPLHYICQSCFSEGRKVVLQGTFLMGQENGLICPSCKGQVLI